MRCLVCGAPALVQKVTIEVSGGVAECTDCPEGVEVQIIDHDDLEAEKLVCPKCHGNFTVFVPSSNPLQGPEIEVACDECGGRGTIAMRCKTCLTNADSLLGGECAGCRKAKEGK